MVPMHGRTAEGAFHQPQSAARILPADQSEERTAGKMPAAPWRCGLTCRRIIAPMHARKRKRALHDQTHLRPIPAAERAIVRAVSVSLLGGVKGGSWAQCSLKQPVEAPRLGTH